MHYFSRRLWTLRFIIISVMLLLTCRLYYLQIAKGDIYKEKAAGNMLRLLPIEAPRGAVFDRKGKILVRNIPSFRVSVIPLELINHFEVLDQLSVILKVPVSQLKERLTGRESQVEPVMIKERLSQEELALLEEERANLPGVRLEIRPIRQYLLGKSSSHFLGYVGEVTEEDIKLNKEKSFIPGDLIGRDGIEKTYDSFLRGKNGFRQMEVDASGRIVQVLGDLEPVSGNDIYLTIDEHVQRAAEKGLEDALVLLKHQNGERTPGSVVALDLRTGGVLAHASSPGYDPNLFSRGITSKEYKALLEEKHFPLLNRIIAGAYPCGSTFKLVTGVAALEEKVVTPDTPVNCNGVFYESGHPFHCFVRSGHGTVRAIEAMGQSCDVYYYFLGHRLGIKRLHHYAEQFGAGQFTGVDLPGELPGLLPGEEWKRKTFPDDPIWYSGETVNLSIGQGYLEVTPMQLAVIGSIVANSGVAYKPHLFYKAVSSNGNIEKNEEVVILRKVNASLETFLTIRKGMRAAVDHGTATAANIKQILVAGKTGTAENLPSKENRYGRNHAWFISFAPLLNPEIVVVVCLEQSGGFGGQWAAPIARRVIEAYFGIDKKAKKRSSTVF